MDGERTEMPLFPFSPDFDIARYSTFEAAEAAAGYHIPRPLAYQLLRGTISLRPAEPTERFPVPSAAMTFLVGSGHIRLEVVPDTIWPHGPPVRLRTERIGGRDGWVERDDDVAFRFVFDCTEPGGRTVWCVVRTTDVEGDAFADFVALLE